MSRIQRLIHCQLSLCARGLCRKSTPLLQVGLMSVSLLQTHVRPSVHDSQSCPSARPAAFVRLVRLATWSSLHLWDRSQRLSTITGSSRLVRPGLGLSTTRYSTDSIYQGMYRAAYHFAADPSRGYTLMPSQPEGYRYNDKRGGIVAGMIIAMVIMMFFTVTRLSLRFFRAGLMSGADDYMLIPGACLAFVYPVLQLVMVTQGGGGKHVWDVTYDEYNLFNKVCLIHGYLELYRTLTAPVRRDMQDPVLHECWSYKAFDSSIPATHVFWIQ